MAKKTPPAPPKITKKPPMPKSITPSMSTAAKSTKTFTISKWTGADQGVKVGIYGASGMGKTTLASMAPKPVYIGIDDGGRKMRNPQTEEALHHVEGIECYDDVIAVLNQVDLFKDFKTIIIDQITLLEDWSVDWIVNNVPCGKGAKASTIESYGYGKGYRHIYEQAIARYTQLDRLVRSGKNIVLIAQSHNVNVPNPSGEDYIAEAPRLSSRKDTSTLALFEEWCDHVVRIGYQGINVDEKKASGTTDRAAFVHPDVWFFAKSHTIPMETPIISFEEPADDTLWKFIFPENYNG